MEPKVSVIVPVYNVEKYIIQCLNSLIKQTLRNVEIILIDDGSTDHSGKICDDYAMRDQRIRVIHKKNAGVAAARNDGLRVAKGKWISFVDPDDFLETDLYMETVRFAEKTSAQVLLFDGVQEYPSYQKNWKHFSKEFKLDATISKSDEKKIQGIQEGVLHFRKCPLKTGVPLAAPWDKLYLREFLEKHQLRFREELKVLDDMVFNMEAFEFADSVSYLPKSLYHYRKVKTSITNTYNPKRPELDEAVFLYIEEFIKKRNKDKNFRNAFMARKRRSFLIRCKLYYFNRKNKNTFINKIKMVVTDWNKIKGIRDGYFD